MKRQTFSNIFYYFVLYYSVLSSPAQPYAAEIILCSFSCIPRCSLLALCCRQTIFVPLREYFQFLSSLCVFKVVKKECVDGYGKRDHWVFLVGPVYPFLTPAVSDLYEKLANPLCTFQFAGDFCRFGFLLLLLSLLLVLSSGSKMCVLVAWH